MAIITKDLGKVTPDIDTTLTQSGQAADAKATGDEIADLKEDIRQKTGLSEEAKVALLDCFEHVAWIDEHGQTYYDNLHDALYPSTDLTMITATFTQGSAVIRNDYDLSVLRQYLTVTAYFADGSSRNVTEYLLSGNLNNSTSVITATYEGKTATFTVNVTIIPIISWDYSSGRLPTVTDGIVTTVLGDSASAEFNQNNGISAYGGTTTSDYVRFEPKDYHTCKKGYFVGVFNVIRYDGYGQVDIRMSDGTNGAKAGMEFGDGESVYYFEGNTGVVIPGVTPVLGEDYTVRLEYEENGTNRLYVNGEKLKETDVISTSWTTANRAYVQGPIAAYIKSMKWVIEEV